MFGPVARGVGSVELVLASGQTLKTSAIDGPTEFSAPLDFYLVEVPRNASVNQIIARDAAGTILERRVIGPTQFRSP